MAGIYIHIPFCKKACHYCDFHFSTSIKYKSELINAIIKEISIQKNYLGNEIVETIYFGGGTPSILETEELEHILEKVYEIFPISDSPEITIECNPDDLSLSKLISLKKTKINRLSIGIQTFDDEILQFLNRAHSSKEAIKCIEDAQNVGYKNINVDLIYGSKNTTNEILKKDLEIIKKLNIQHISAYNLTIEEKTVFGNWLKKGKIPLIDDEHSSIQYQLIEDYLENESFIHYEISNYAKEGYFSEHNSSYWKQKKYLGIGPSAHSYNGISRHYVIKNNAIYTKSINEENKLPIEIEKLTRENLINEYLMTGLRTIWGCDLDYLQNLSFNFQEIKEKEIKNNCNKGYLILENNYLKLTKLGRLFTDSIVIDLMIQD